MFYRNYQNKNNMLFFITVNDILKNNQLLHDY